MLITILAIFNILLAIFFLCKNGYKIITERKTMLREDVVLNGSMVSVSILFLTTMLVHYI